MIVVSAKKSEFVRVFCPIFLRLSKFGITSIVLACIGLPADSVVRLGRFPYQYGSLVRSLSRKRCGALMSSLLLLATPTVTVIFGKRGGRKLQIYRNGIIRDSVLLFTGRWSC